MLIFGAHGWFNTMLIKLNNNTSTANNLKKAETIFKKYNPEYPFEYQFIDEEYAKKFENEQRVSTLAALFAGLTIFISCLGLFGLATYMAENRIKEIGVRKVLGASIPGIAALLSKDFLKLVIISFVLAAPIAWWAMHAWLQDYSFRVKIEWWVFALAGLLSILIAIITVSYQAIKAAIANPVKSLRTE
jgi:ABC-type antimicrobial peptide transport system permease subunit